MIGNLIAIHISQWIRVTNLIPCIGIISYISGIAYNRSDYDFPGRVTFVLMFNVDTCYLRNNSLIFNCIGFIHIATRFHICYTNGIISRWIIGQTTGMIWSWLVGEGYFWS